MVEVYGQDSLLIQTLASNKHPFETKESKSFRGLGWDLIVAKAAENQYTLVGEIHGINEIPLFLSALANEIKYETFVAEIDPYLSYILQDKLGNLTEIQLKDWQKKAAGNLSFYSYKNDFELLKALRLNGIDIIGIDQITALNDAPIYQYLSENTGQLEKQMVFQKMAKQAQTMLPLVVTTPQSPPYLMSSLFESDLTELKSHELSAQEQEIVEKLEYSRGIYTSQDGHQKRIKLMKNQLMNQYGKSLDNKKGLFRLGANHSVKGESLLTIYDIGNFVHNLAESQLNSSYHLAIFSTSGEAGNPFIGQANTEVKLPKELAFLSNLAYEDKWTYFDLVPLRKEIETGKIKLDNEFIL